MLKSATCRECGYSGEMAATIGAYSWGSCPKCGTTNLDVVTICDDCGTEESEVHGSLKLCLTCHPPTPPDKEA